MTLTTALPGEGKAQQLEAIGKAALRWHEARNDPRCKLLRMYRFLQAKRAAFRELTKAIEAYREARCE